MKAYIKIEKIIKFDDIEIQKQKFHQHKETIPIKNIDISKIVVSNKVSFGKKGFKCFISYKDVKKLDFYICFYQKYVLIEKTFMKLNLSFLIKNDELSENYNQIWEKVPSKKKTTTIKKDFDSDPVYKGNYLKAKIKFCNRKITTNFHNNEVPKEGSKFKDISNLFVFQEFWSILFLEHVNIIILKCF